MVLEGAVDEPIHSSPPNKRRRKGEAMTGQTVFEDSVDEAMPSSPPIVIAGTAGPATAPPSGADRGQDHEVADDFNPEDFNIRSQARTELLTELKGLLNKSVPPVFWAGCQLADMDSLKVLIGLAKMKPALVLTNQGILENVPRLCELLDVLGYIEVVFNYRHAYS
jgi:hypothetical protein